MNVFKWLTNPRFVLVYPVAVALFWFAKTTGRGLFAGAVLVMLGEAVRLWANGYVGDRKVNRTDASHEGRKIGRLVTTGPYAFVRHPLYFGSFVIGLGFMIIVGRPWLLLGAIPVLWAYHRKIRQEEAVLAHEAGREHVDYVRRVPAVIPTLRRYPHGEGQWNWRGVQASREIKTLIWVIVLIVVFYLRKDVVQDHDFLQPAKLPQQIFAMALASTLIAIDLVSELRRRIARPSTALDPSR